MVEQRIRNAWVGGSSPLNGTRLKPLHVKGFNVFKFFRHERYKFLSNQPQIIIDFKQKFYYLYIWLKLSTPPSWCALFVYRRQHYMPSSIVYRRQSWQNGHFRTSQAPNTSPCRFPDTSPYPETSSCAGGTLSARAALQRTHTQSWRSRRVTALSLIHI